jgi:uncharacterized oligopeptide transporter (OPT) family protein
MKLVIDGVLQQELPWTLVAIGAAIAVACELVGIPALPFAVGVYLPVSTMTPVFLGGALRWWLERGARDEEQAAQRREQGVLLGSGFVGGEGLLGVAVAGVAFATGARPAGFGTGWGTEWLTMLAGAGLFAGLAIWFLRMARREY